MSSRDLLLAWELGAGLGHARRLLITALALKQRGWSPTVAAREVWACAADYRQAGIPLIQAPIHRGLRAAESAHFRARSFADIMAACSYRGAEELHAMVSAWDHLIQILGPRAIVTDYSPILALAAYDRVPVIAIGDGFVLPPPNLPKMPALRPGGSPPALEGELLTNIAIVQRRRGCATPRSLPALIGGQAHVVCTYCETDIYAQQRIQPASGPLNATSRPLTPPVKKAIYAYLAADERHTPKLLHVLSNSGFPVEAFVRDASSESKRALRASAIHVHEVPPPINEVADRASLIVHHGGIGTIEACLALGRPQLLIPRHLEQWLNASTVGRLGAAVALKQPFSLAEGAAAVSAAISSKHLIDKTQQLAHLLATRPTQALDEVVDKCQALATKP